MDAKPVRQEIDTKEFAMEKLVMGLREQLMEYYKGTCVRRFVYLSDIQLRDLAEYAHTRYNYQRQTLENERPMMLLVKDVPLLTMKKAPARLVFHTATLSRSPQFKEIHKQLNQFMSKYLPAVRKEDSDATIGF